MKKSTLVFIACFSTFLVGHSFAQKQKSQTINIKTSVECEACKNKIEQLLQSEKGIKKVTVNLETKEAMVTYDERKITKSTIYSAISNAGYDADSIPANNKALQHIRIERK